ncbi:MAG: hypothetical protein DRN99_07405 [Thermoproteota archaeon]|nr:MAG: hypothetical protein DRN99_07405 [Candidatus Korarchaeota archaeon]
MSFVIAEGLPDEFSERARATMKPFRRLKRGIGRRGTIAVLNLRGALDVPRAVLEAAFDGVVFYDRGEVERLFKAIRKKVKELGLVRYRTADGCYGWKLPGRHVVIKVSEGEVIGH